MHPYDVAIIGGGASGLTAAIAAARTGARVLLLEAGERVGRKLLATGNGRCNLSNARIAPDCYHGDAAFLRALFAACPPERVHSFFNSLGLATVTEGPGRIYPFSGLASSVLDVLRLGLDAAGVTVTTACPVEAIEKETAGFRLLADGQPVAHARKVILTCGGLAAPKLGSNGSGYDLARSLGHSLVPPAPALTPLTASLPGLAALKGIRTRAALTLSIAGKPVQSETGELLFTEYGLSGVCAMQLALEAGRGIEAGQAVTVSIDFLPGLEPQSFFVKRQKALEGASLSAFFTGLLHRRIGELLLRTLSRELPGLDHPIGELSPKALSRLAGISAAFPVRITGTRGFAQAQVTGGGIPTGEVCPETLASLCCAGLYLAGELLDLDGPCGGYNLHLAWTEGLLSGAAAGKESLCCTSH